jgi:hypothetical protein
MWLDRMRCNVTEKYIWVQLPRQAALYNGSLCTFLRFRPVRYNYCVLVMVTEKYHKSVSRIGHTEVNLHALDNSGTRTSGAGEFGRMGGINIKKMNRNKYKILSRALLGNATTITWILRI